MRRTLFVLLLCLLALPAAAADRVAAGMRQIAYLDPHSGRQAPITVWYPADAEETDLRRGPYRFRAAPDAPVASGGLPLVVISHGWGGNMRGHLDTGLHLARQGFAVAAVQHVGNASSDNALGETPQVWDLRPRQLAAAIDAAVAALPVDATRVGLLGYSAGGYTVLAYMGGEADTARVADHCRAHPEDAGFCGFGIQAARPEAPVVIDRQPDPRVRAVAALAPVGALFVDGGLSRVTVPVRLYRAEKDELVGAVQLERVRDALPNPPEYVVVENAGHYAFMAPFAPESAAGLGPLAEDPPGFDRVAFHEHLNTELADFFGRTLR